jgi:REP element-mobilizing transposase RayT
VLWGQDRTAWIQWLFKAKKRYGLEVLNYTVTSNHIHLLVYSSDDREVIPRAMQLVAGRVAQEYNQRKNRKGAFWEDRYHATAVDTNEHLVRCLAYIDLNMLRAGVVSHPREWSPGGWHEIVNPPRRYRIIARERLKQLLDADEKTLIDSYVRWVENYIGKNTEREKIWTEAIATGSAEFVEGIKEKRWEKVKYRHIHNKIAGGAYALKEATIPYNAHLDGKKVNLGDKNRLLWDIFPDI